MSCATAFLRSIWPQEQGVFFVAAPGRVGGFQHFGFDNIERACEKAQELEASGRDAYFACSQYGQVIFSHDANGKPKMRVADNVVRAKAMWLDLDVEAGSAVKYPTKQAALDDLVRFVKTVSLPRPTVVDSGYGLHVYWALKTSLPPDRWLLASGFLKAAAAHLGLRADPTRTSDIASVLRVPGTSNFKRGGAKKVGIVGGLQPEHSQTEVCGALQKFCGANGLQPVTRHNNVLALPGTPHLVGANESLLAASLGGGIVKQFDPVDIVGIASRCAQVKEIYETGGNVPEPLWYAGIGLACYSADPDTMIHELSNGYAGYNPAEVERKAAQWKAQVSGPPTCATFYSANPTGCDGCPHRGKINSPATLAKEVAPPPPMPTIPTCPPPPPVTAAAISSFSSVELEAVMDDTGIVLGYVAACPHGFRRTKSGVEFMKKATKPDEEDKWVPLGAMDFFPINTYRDEVNQLEMIKVAVLQARTDRDDAGEWKFVDMPSSSLADGTFTKYFYNLGLYPWTMTMTSPAGRYLVSYISELKKTIHTANLRQQMGWMDDDQTFVTGESTYHADGSVGRTLPNDSVKYSIGDYASKGTLAAWQAAFDVYALPGLERHAFAAMAAFAAPIFRFTNYSGVIMSLIGSSAAGKTTIQQVINAAWGHPENTMLVLRDSPKAQMRRMALANHLPICVNEGTSISPEQMSTTAYAVSEGRYGRGLRQNRQEMSDALTWETISIWSSNRSLRNIMAETSGDTTAQGLRMLEFTVPSGTLDKAVADSAFRPLRENYGHAGPIFARHIIQHRDTIKDEVRDAIVELDRDFGTGSQERYWIALVASVVVANKHAVKLGLSKIKTSTLVKTAMDILGVNRETIVASRQGATDTLSRFMAQNISAFTVTHTPANGLVNTLTEARGRLCGVIQRDKGECHILLSAFSAFCHDLHLDVRDSLAELNEMGMVLSMPTTKTLHAGNGVSLPRTLVFTVNMDHPSFSGKLVPVPVAA